MLPERALCKRAGGNASEPTCSLVNTVEEDESLFHRRSQYSYAGSRKRTHTDSSGVPGIACAEGFRRLPKKPSLSCRKVNCIKDSGHINRKVKGLKDRRVADDAVVLMKGRDRTTRSEGRASA